MIIGGHSSTGYGLARYLTEEKNHGAEIWNIRDCELPELVEAVRDWQMDAIGTKAEKPVYHAWIRPSDTDRALTREEWETAISHFEKEMGFENQPRAVIYHNGHEQGEQGHIHLIYSRIEDGKAISDSWNYVHHEKARAEIEKELGLEHVYSPHLDDEPRRAQSPTLDQIEQGKRTKIDPREVKAEVSELYRASDSGPAFVAALEDSGYTLAKGDKRGYVILDEAGGVHSLTRAADAKAAELRDRLKDYPLQNLPTVEAARELIQDRAQGRENDHDRAAWEDRLHAAAIEKEEREKRFTEPKAHKNGLVFTSEPKPEKELNATAADIRLSYTLSDSGQGFREALKERGLILAEVSRDEAEHSQRAAAYAKELDRFAPTLKEGELVAVNQRGHLYRLNERTTGESRDEINKFLGTLNREDLPDLTEARAEQREIAKAEFKAQRYEAHDLERQAFAAVAAVGLLEGPPQPDPEAERAKAFKLAETIQERGGENPARLAVEETAQARAEAGKGLDCEQTDALFHATDNAFSVIQGRAGTGKSFTLDAIREAYERGGYQVIGLAPTHAAAQELRGAGFSEARTLQSYLYAEQKRVEQGRPAPEGSRVLIVDEAGMVSNRQLTAIMETAAAQGARVVLAGDDRQLKSIEQGGLFGALATEHAAELTTVYRQRDDWQKDATRAFAQGDTAAGLQAYHERGFIHYADGDRTQAAAELVKQWVSDRDEGRTGSRFVFSVTNADTHAVNQMIQAEQIKAGIVKDARAYTVTDGREILIGEGDRLQLRGNDKANGLFNGMLGTVEKIDPAAPHLLNVRFDNGEARSIDTGEYRDFQLGYAGTVYRGQGKTLDRSYVLFSPYMDGRAAYVASTRAREETHLYAATGDLDARHYRGHVRAQGLEMPESHFQKLVAVIDGRTAYNEQRPTPEERHTSIAPQIDHQPAPYVAERAEAREAVPVAAIVDDARELTGEAGELIDRSLQAADRLAAGTVAVIGKGVEAVASLFESLFEGPKPQPTPEQAARIEARHEARAKDDAEAKAEAKQRKEAEIARLLQQMEESEREHREREKERRGRERER